MNDPDKKLLELLKVALSGTDAFVLGDSYLRPIKQAFKDAGYEKLHEKGAYDAMNKAVKAMQESVTVNKLEAVIKKYLLAGGSPEFVVMPRTDWERNAKSAGLMSGQEWYDRFEKKLHEEIDQNGKFPDHLDDYNVENILSAAKKAAGLL